MVNLWATTASPVDPAQADVGPAHCGVAPPPNGTVVRIIDFPTEPADGEKRRQAYMASRRAIFGDLPLDRNGDAAHPGMHRTATVDYAVVLEGEIHAVLDEGETLLRAGNILYPARHQPCVVQPLRRELPHALRADRRGEGVARPGGGGGVVVRSDRPLSGRSACSWWSSSRPCPANSPIRPAPIRRLPSPCPQRVPSPCRTAS